ncbi:GNAT family N-acetyltransferase [Micromonospora radicis]|uniref:GNAT family N-acetyltransferase n=1 Tax=Micromonospora radicis TaxID=1894971 RepID=A0A418MS69_9ACTN|nr:GNAT family N-acetyltransferase [Micromonospora radicis]RIV37020.1 GNAT family N-acetyltransferase [Micromonospora radicis]
MSDGPGGDFDVAADLGSVLRALRRQADLSQRELAQLAGVPQSTVGRIESEQGLDPRFRTVQRLVAAAGGTLWLTAASCAAGPGHAGCAAGPGHAGCAPGPGQAEGNDCVRAAVGDMRDDTRRDDAGRRYPAHLDVREVRTLKDWPGAWWAHWYSLPPEQWPLRVPDVTYDLDRGRRDERRVRVRLRDAVRIRRVVDGVPPGCWRLVAELPDGDLVGELRAHERSLDLLYGESLGDRREVVLDGVVVAPPLRLLGIGRKLVTRLAAETRRAGLGAIRAVAEFGGAGFLRACGYRTEDHRPVALCLEHRPPSASPASPLASPASVGKPGEPAAPGDTR